jgi:hypothetical protein
MKITLKPDHVAVLSNDNGEIVGCFKPCDYADEKLMQIVGFYYDVDSVALVTYRDFEQPLNYEYPYEFILYHSDGTDEYVTLKMTYEKIY